PASAAPSCAPRLGVPAWMRRPSSRWIASRRSPRDHVRCTRAGKPLLNDAQQKQRHLHQISPPQPGRLLQQAIGPFEAGLPNPARGARNNSGHEVEEAADTETETAAGGLEISVEP